MHALLILDVVLQVSGTQHQDTNLAGPSKMDVSVSSLALYEKYPLRVLISAKPKTSGLLPDMASICYNTRADVHFGVLLHIIACADRHPICLYRLKHASRLGASEGASRLYQTVNSRSSLFDIEVSVISLRRVSRVSR